MLKESPLKEMPLEESSLKESSLKESSRELNTSANMTKGLSSHALTSMIWLFFSVGLQALLRVGILAIMARLLTHEDFGLANLALTIVGFAGFLSQLGLDRALIQRPELTDAHLRTASTIFTLTGIVLAALIFALAPQIASFFRNEALTPIVRVVAIAFPLQGIVIVPAALLERELEFRRVASIGVITYIIGYAVVGIGLALMGFGVWALIAAGLVQGVLLAIWLIAVQPFPKRPLLDGQAFRDLVHYGGGHTMARLLYQTGGQADNIIVGRSLSVEALGVYGRAYQLLVAPADFASSVVNKVLFPSLAKVQNDRTLLARTHRRGTATIALAYLPLSAMLIVLAPELVLVLLGPQWQDAVLPFQILATGMLFRADKINHAVVNATGAVYQRAWREGIFALMVIVGSLIGVRWGLAGVAAGVLIALATNFALLANLALSVSGLSVRQYLACFVPASRVAAVTIVVVWLVASALRVWLSSALLILVGAGLMGGVSALLLTLLLPKIFLGQEGMWTLNALLKILPKPVSTKLAWLQISQSDITI
jgi:PST family polysaccharide transporter